MPAELGKTFEDQVPALLSAWSQGDQAALESLIPLVEGELRRLASHYLQGERRGHTLQTTALVNEAYLRLMDGAKGMRWQNRAHFIAIAAQVMRRILVDAARKHRSGKRGGDFIRESLGQAVNVPQVLDEDLVALDEALILLSASDARASRVVELRFFGGLSAEETAEVMQISTDTVARDWNFAKVWLRRRLASNSPSPNPVPCHDS
jgi:RNA polymerase sigma-70 factor (ECF subfamily)